MIGSPVVYFSIAGMLAGVLGMIFARNIIKKILAFGIVETSINLIYVGVSSRSGIIPPIVRDGVSLTAYADPIPQAVIITGIIISFALLCLALVFAVIIQNHYHTMDVNTIETSYEREESC